MLLPNTYLHRTLAWYTGMSSESLPIVIFNTGARLGSHICFIEVGCRRAALLHLSAESARRSTFNTHKMEYGLSTCSIVSYQEGNHFYGVIYLVELLLSWFMMDERRARSVLTGIKFFCAEIGLSSMESSLEH